MIFLFLASLGRFDTPDVHHIESTPSRSSEMNDNASICSGMVIYFNFICVFKHFVCTQIFHVRTKNLHYTFVRIVNSILMIQLNLH